MKKHIIIALGLFAIIILIALSLYSDPPPKVRLLQLKDYDASSNDLVSEGKLREIETGYLMLHKTGDGESFIYYLDQTEDRWIPMCAEPTCPHDDWEYCYAHVSSADDFYLYHRHIRYAEIDSKLVSTVDAKQHRKEYYVNQWADRALHIDFSDIQNSNENGGEDNIFFEYSSPTKPNRVPDHFSHNQNLYVCITAEDETGWHYEICRADRVRYETETIGRLPGTEKGRLIGFADEQTVFFIWNCTDRNYLFRYDETMGSFEQLSSDFPSVNAVALTEEGCYLTTTGHKLLWMDTRTGRVRDEGIRLCAEKQDMWTDGHYLFVGALSKETAEGKEPGGKLDIYDMKGKLIQRIELPPKDTYLMNTAGSRLFFTTESDTFHGLEYGPTYYLDKQKIGTEQAILIPIAIE